MLLRIKGTKFESCTINGGRYGLGSKDTTPAHIIAVFKTLIKRKNSHYRYRG